MLVTADEMWGTPCLAYHIQAIFPRDALDAIAQLQCDLGAFGLPAFNLCPRHSQHLSIYTLVPVRLPIAGKEDYWASISAVAFSDLDRLCRGRRRIALHFNEVRITSSAIIAVASAVHDLIGDIREHFSRWPAPSGRIAPTYDIAHVTLARFSVAAQVPATLIREISARPPSIDATISRVRLVRETVYPSLEVDELSIHDLL